MTRLAASQALDPSVRLYNVFDVCNDCSLDFKAGPLSLDQAKKLCRRDTGVHFITRGDGSIIVLNKYNETIHLIRSAE